VHAFSLNLVIVALSYKEGNILGLTHACMTVRFLGVPATKESGMKKGKDCCISVGSFPLFCSAFGFNSITFPANLLFYVKPVNDR